MKKKDDEYRCSVRRTAILHMDFESRLHKKRKKLSQADKNVEQMPS